MEEVDTGRIQWCTAGNTIRVQSGYSQGNMGYSGVQ